MAQDRVAQLIARVDGVRRPADAAGVANQIAIVREDEGITSGEYTALMTRLNDRLTAINAQEHVRLAKIANP